MFISQVKVTNLSQLHESLGYIRRLNIAYSQHQLIWTLFSEVNKEHASPFLFRLDSSEHSRYSFIVVSTIKPDTIVEVAGQRESLRGIEVISKPYTPKISDGETLSFVLTANPVIHKAVKGKRSKRHDVVMHWKYQSKDRKEKALSDIVQDEGYRWLKNKGIKHGFELIDDTSARSYRQHRFFKSNQRNPIKISSIDFSGLLTVTSNADFTEMLFNGIGPAKRFGMGLMLVRRIE